MLFTGRRAAPQLTIENGQLTIMVSPSATYFNHFRRKYHNCQLSIVNCQFARMCAKQQFIVATSVIRWLKSHRIFSAKIHKCPYSQDIFNIFTQNMPKNFHYYAKFSAYHTNFKKAVVLLAKMLYNSICIIMRFYRLHCFLEVNPK